VQAFMKLAESASKMGLPPFKHWEFPVKLAEDAALASDYPSSIERNRRAFQDYYFASCLD